MLTKTSLKTVLVSVLETGFPCAIVGGSVNWYGLFGGQFGYISNALKFTFPLT